MKRQRTYTIFRNSRGEVDAVYNGWSWLAFLISFIWAFAKGLYGLRVIVLSAFILFGFLWWAKILLPETIILLCLIAMGLMGFGHLIQHIRYSLYKKYVVRHPQNTSLDVLSLRIYFIILIII